MTRQSGYQPAPSSKRASARDQLRVRELVGNLLDDSRQAVYGGHLFDAVRFSDDVQLGEALFSQGAAPGLRRVQLPRDGRALKAFVRRFQERHGRKAGQFATAMLVLPLAACSSLGVDSGSDAPLPGEEDEPVAPLEGVVIDGYLAGAEVARADGSGGAVLTDDQGRFDGLEGSGPVVASGGIDVATGLPFTGELLAPGEAAVVTPLTTLVQARLAHGLDDSADAAALNIVEQFGLGSAFEGTSLLELDPVATDNLEVYAQGARVANALSLTSAAGGDANAVATALAENASLLSNPAGLTASLENAGLGASQAGDLATAIINAGAAIADAPDREGVARIQYLVQGEWVDAAAAGELLEGKASRDAIEAAAARAPISGDQGGGADAPLATLTLDTEALAQGETAQLVIEFSAVPADLDADSLAALLAVSGGTLVDLAQDPDAPARFTAEFVPDADTEGMAEVVLPGGSYQDGDGTPGTGAIARAPFDTREAGLTVAPLAAPEPGLAEQADFGFSGQAPEAAAGGSLELTLRDGDAETLTTAVAIDDHGHWQVSGMQLFALARGQTALELQARDAAGEAVVTLDTEGPLLPAFADTPATAELSEQDVAALLEAVPADSLSVDAAGMTEAQLTTWVEALDQVAIVEQLEVQVDNLELVLQELIPSGKLDAQSLGLDATRMAPEGLLSLVDWLAGEAAGPATVTGELELSAGVDAAMIGRLLEAATDELQAIATLSGMDSDQLAALTVAEAGVLSLVGDLEVRPGVDAGVVAELLPRMESGQVELQPDGLDDALLLNVAEVLAAGEGPVAYVLEGPLTLTAAFDADSLETMFTGLTEVRPTVNGTELEPALEADLTDMDGTQLARVAGLMPALEGLLPLSLTGEATVDAGLSVDHLRGLLTLAGDAPVVLAADAEGMEPQQVWELLDAPDLFESIRNLKLTAETLFTADLEPLFSGDALDQDSATANVTGMSAPQLDVLSGHLQQLASVSGSLELTAALAPEVLTAWLAAPDLELDSVVVDLADMSAAQQTAVADGLSRVDTLALAAGQTFTVTGAENQDLVVTGAGTLALTGSLTAATLDNPDLAPGTLDLTAAELAADVTGLALNETSTFVLTPDQTLQLHADGIQGTGTADRIDVDVSGEDFSDGNVPEVTVALDLGAGDDEVTFRFGAGPDDRSVALSDDSVIDFGSGSNVLSASEGTVDVSAASLSTEPDGDIELRVNSGLSLSADQFQLLLDGLGDGSTASLAGAGRVEITGTLSSGQLDLSAFGDNFTAGGLTPPTLDLVDMDASVLEGDPPELVLPEAGADVRILLDGEPVSGFDAEEIEAEQVTVYTEGQLQAALGAIDGGADVQVMTIAVPLELAGSIDLAAASELEVSAVGSLQVAEGETLTLTPDQAAALAVNGAGTTVVKPVQDGNLPEGLAAGLSSGSRVLHLEDELQVDGRNADLTGLTSVQLDTGRLTLSAGQASGLVAEGDAGTLQLTELAGLISLDLGAVAVPALELELDANTLFASALAAATDTLVLEATDPDSEPVIELGNSGEQLPALQVAASVTAWVTAAQANGLQASGAGTVGVHGFEGAVEADLAALQAGRLVAELDTAAVDSLGGELGAGEVLLTGSGSVQVKAGLEWGDAIFLHEQGAAPELVFGAELSAQALEGLLTQADIDPGIGRVVNAEGMSADQLASVLAAGDGANLVRNLTLDAGFSADALADWLSLSALDLDSLQLQTADMDAAQLEAITATLGGELNQADSAESLGLALQALLSLAESESPLAAWGGLSGRVQQALQEDLLASRPDEGFDVSGLLSAEDSEQATVWTHLIELHEHLDEALVAVNSEALETARQPRELTLDELEDVVAAYQALPESAVLSEARQDDLQKLDARLGPLLDSAVTEGATEHLEELLGNLNTELSQAFGGLDNLQVVKITAPIVPGGQGVLSRSDNPTVHYNQVDHAIVRSDGTLFAPNLAARTPDFDGVFEFDELVALRTEVELSQALSHGFFQHDSEDPGLLLVTTNGQLLSAGSTTISMPDELSSELSFGVAQVEVADRNNPKVLARRDDGEVFGWWDEQFDGGRGDAMARQIEHMSEAGIAHIFSTGDTGSENLIAVTADGQAFHWGRRMAQDPDMIVPPAGPGEEILDVAFANLALARADVGNSNFFTLRADGAIETNLPASMMTFRGSYETTRFDDGERVDWTIPPRITGGGSTLAIDESTFDYGLPNWQVGEPSHDPSSWVFAGRAAMVAGTQENYLEELFSESALLATNPVLFTPRWFPRSTDPREFPGDLLTHPGREDTEFVVENPLLTSGFVQIAGGGRSLMALDESGAVHPVGNVLGTNTNRFDPHTIRDVNDLIFDDLGLDSGVVELLGITGSRGAHQKDYVARKEDGELVFWRGQEAFEPGSDQVADLLASGNRAFMEMQFADYRANRHWNDLTVSVIRDDDSVVTYELTRTVIGPSQQTRTINTVDTTELNEALAERGPYTEIVETYTNVGVALHESGEVTLWSVPTGELIGELPYDSLRFARGYGETYADVIAGDDFVAIEGSLLVREDGSLVPLPTASGNGHIGMRFSTSKDVLEQLATSSDDTLPDVAALTGELGVGFEVLLLEELNQGSSAFAVRDAAETLLLTAPQAELQEALAGVWARDDLDYEAFVQQWTHQLLEARPDAGFASLDQALDAVVPPAVSMVALAELGDQVLAQANDAVSEQDAGALWQVLDSQLRDGLAAEAVGLEAHESLPSWSMDAVESVLAVGQLLEDLDAFLAQDGVSESEDAAQFLAQRLLAAAPADGFDAATDMVDALGDELAALQTLVTTGLDQQAEVQAQEDDWFGLLYTIMLPPGEVLDRLADGADRLQAHADFVAAGNAPLVGLESAAAQAELATEVEAFADAEVFDLSGADWYVHELLALHAVELHGGAFDSIVTLLDITRQAAGDITALAEEGAVVDTAIADAQTPAALVPWLDPDADTREALEQGAGLLASYADYLDLYAFELPSMAPAAALNALVQAVDDFRGRADVDGDAVAFLAGVLDKAGPDQGFDAMVPLQEALADALPGLTALVTAGTDAKQALAEAVDAADLAAVLGQPDAARAVLEDGNAVLDLHAAFRDADSQTPLSGLVAAEGLRALLAAEDGLLTVEGVEAVELRLLLGAETLARLDEVPETLPELADEVGAIAGQLLPLTELAVELPDLLQGVQSEADARELLAEIRPLLAAGQELLARNAALEAEQDSSISSLLSLWGLATATAALAEVGERDTVTQDAVDSFVAELLFSAGELPASAEALAASLDGAVQAAGLADELVTGINQQDLAATRNALDDLAVLAAGLGLPALAASAIEAVQDAADALPEGEQQEALDTLSSLAPGQDWTIGHVLDGSLLDRALDSFQDSDAVFVPEEFQVENVLGDTVTVTIDDLIEQPGWHLLAAEATRDQTAALVLANDAAAEAEDLLVELRIVDLNTGAVLAGRGLETEPAAPNSDMRVPAEGLVRSPGPEPFIYLGHVETEDDRSLTLTRYRADAEIGPIPEAVGERVLTLPEEQPVWSPGDGAVWLPANDAEGPDYLLQEDSAYGDWPQLLAFFGDDDAPGQPVPIGGLEPGDFTFLNVLDVFRAGGDLWMHFSAFSEMLGGDLPEYVRFQPLEGGSQLMAEPVSADVYMDARTEALQLDTLVPIGDRLVDPQDTVGDVPLQIDDSWSVEKLEDGRTLVRAEVLPDAAQPLGYEHWLLYDADGELLADRAFDAGEAALVRSLQGADGSLYAQQLASETTTGDFRQADPVTLYEIAPKALEALLGDDSASLADVAGISELQTHSLDALTDGAASAPGAENELVQLQAWYADGDGDAVGVVAQHSPGAEGSTASFWVEHSDGAALSARSLPGSYENLQYLDADTAGLQLQMADAHGSWAARFDLTSEAFTGLPVTLLEALRQDDPLQAGLAQADGLIDPQTVDLDALPEDVLAWSLREQVATGAPGGMEQVLVFDVLFADGRLGSALVGVEGSGSIIDGPRLLSTNEDSDSNGSAVVEVTRDLVFTTGQLQREDEVTAVVVNALDLEASGGPEQQIYQVRFEETEPDAPRELSITMEAGPSLDLPDGGLEQLGLSEFGRIDTAVGLIAGNDASDVLGLSFQTRDPALGAPAALQGVFLEADQDDGSLTPIEGRNTLDLRMAPPLQLEGVAALTRDPDLAGQQPLDVVFASQEGELLEAEVAADALLSGLDDVDPEALRVDVLDFAQRGTQDNQASFLFAVQPLVGTEQEDWLHLVRAEAELVPGEVLTLQADASATVAGTLDPALFDPSSLVDLGMVPRTHDDSLYLRYLDPADEPAFLVLDDAMAVQATGLDARAELLLARSDHYGLPLEPDAFIRDASLDFSRLEGESLEVSLANGGFNYISDTMGWAAGLFDPDTISLVIGSDGDDLLMAGPNPVTLRGGAGDDLYQLDTFASDPGNSHTLLFEADPELNGFNEITGFFVGDPDSGGDVIGFEGLDQLALGGNDLQQVEDLDGLALGTDTGLLAFSTVRPDSELADLQADLDPGSQLMVLVELESAPDQVGLHVLTGTEDGERSEIEQTATFAGLGAGALGVEVLDENLRDFNAL